MFCPLQPASVAAHQGKRLNSDIQVGAKYMNSLNSDSLSFSLVKSSGVQNVQPAASHFLVDVDHHFKLTNVDANRSYQLLLMKVNSVSDFMTGQNFNCLFVVGFVFSLHVGVSVISLLGFAFKTCAV